MGNAAVTSAGPAGGRKAKIMKTNGEFFKLATPAKVRDIIANYPGHILLDSDEFRRFNLRAQPLDPEFHIQAKKIYLLVELPRFPTQEEEDAGDGDGETSSQPPASPVRVKLKLPKAQVERILEETSDDAEAAGKIIDLCIEGDGRAVPPETETTEKVSFSKHCVNLHPKLRIPCTNQRSKYKKLKSG